jgi:hypothetical protein
MVLSRGDLVEVDGTPCVVVALAGEPVGPEHVPEDHVALWFGNPVVQLREEATTQGKPEVWTVPLEYVQQGQVPVVRH